VLSVAGENGIQSTRRFEMEGIDIDSIVRKAVTEYRRQERDLAETKTAHTMTVLIDDLMNRVRALEREIGKYRP
jgi:hypothetical protein